MKREKNREIAIHPYVLYNVFMRFWWWDSKIYCFCGEKSLFYGNGNEIHVLYASVLLSLHHFFFCWTRWKMNVKLSEKPEKTCDMTITNMLLLCAHLLWGARTFTVYTRFISSYKKSMRDSERLFWQFQKFIYFAWNESFSEFTIRLMIACWNEPVLNFVLKSFCSIVICLHLPTYTFEKMVFTCATLRFFYAKCKKKFFVRH